MKFTLPSFLEAERLARALALAAWRQKKPPQLIGLAAKLSPAVANAAKRHLGNLGYTISSRAEWQLRASDAAAEWDGFTRQDNPFLWPARSEDAMPAAQIRELDRSAIEERGIPGLCLMENAGISATAVAAELYDNTESGEGAVILVGPGNNGGDGLVVARGLLCRGIPVKIFTICDLKFLRGDAAANLAILQTSGVSVERLRLAKDSQTIGQGRVIIDGLFGTGLARRISGEAADLIAAVNESRRPVLALDVPSGLHADSGEMMGTAIKARCTVTFAAPKKGFWLARGPEHCGDVVVADIGIRPATSRAE